MVDTNKVKVGLWIFGGVLFIVCVGGLIWSLFRPPVTNGPEPPMPDGMKHDASMG